MAFIEPCFGIGHNLSLICQMTSEDIKHQLIIPLRSRVYFPLTVHNVLSPYGPLCTFPLQSRVYFPLTVQCVLSPYNPVCTFPLRSSGTCHLWSRGTCHLRPVCTFPLWSSDNFFLKLRSCGSLGECYTEYRQVPNNWESLSAWFFDAPKHVTVRGWILRSGHLAVF